MKEILLILLTGHFIGDFYLQSSTMAIKKDVESKWVIKHSLIYGVPFLFLSFLFYFNVNLILASLVSILVHFLVDYLKFIFIKDPKERSKPRIFLIDQSIHLFFLLIIAYYFKVTTLTSLPIIESIFRELNIPFFAFIRWSLAIIMIYKPSNIIFMKLFSSYKPKEVPVETEINSAIEFRRAQRLKSGGIIGGLEKLIILFFLVANQPMAAGLVLTAKSIARYDKISKNSNFAEYYLIGTLTSMLLVLLIHQLVFVVLS